MLVAFRPLGIGYSNWGLIAKVNTAEAYEPVARLRRLLLALGGGIMLLGLGMLFVMDRRTSRRMRPLQSEPEGAKAIRPARR